MPNVITSVVISTCCQCVTFSILLFLQSNPALAQSEEIQLAANYCAKYENSIKLSENDMILCFDGLIRADLQMDDQLRKLNDHGFFVIRSPGGFFPAAMKIADILLEKDATVIIHDYCLSACANYIFVATGKTHVLKNSVVAWHGGPSSTYCDRYLHGDQSAIGSGRVTVCKNLALQIIFFQKRGIQNGFIFNPPTPYTRMMFNILAKTPGNKSKVFWMWNPKNYGDHFKDRIFYEKYPNSQSDVDEIIDHFRLGTQVIYDPAL